MIAAQSGSIIAIAAPSPAQECVTASWDSVTGAALLLAPGARHDNPSRAMTRVHRVSPIDLWSACMWLDMEGHRKLVLLALCENSDQHGLCYPGRESIAQRASVSPRNASTHLKGLEEDGWVSIVRNAKGPGTTTIRRVNIQRVVAEGRKRQDEFSAHREPPPLLALLDEAAIIGADSAPVAPDHVILSTPIQVIPATPEHVILSTSIGDPSRLRNQPVEPGSGNQPAEPASSPQTAVQDISDASGTSDHAGEKISPAASEIGAASASPIEVFAGLLKRQLSAEELDLLLDSGIEVDGDQAVIEIPPDDYAQISDRTASKIRTAARGAGISKVRLQQRAGATA